jgi:hypothetical protein
VVQESFVDHLKNLAQMYFDLLADFFLFGHTVPSSFFTVLKLT